MMHEDAWNRTLRPPLGAGALTLRPASRACAWKLACVRWHSPLAEEYPSAHAWQAMPS